jgi:hypothetical protein
MTAAIASGAPRQSAILMAVAGLHVGAIIVLVRRIPDPVKQLHPGLPVPADYVPQPAPLPDIDFPRAIDEAAARRMAEAARAFARIVVGADGCAASWTQMQGSGLPRLDAALGCVNRRLQFLPGRRDGRAVAAEVQLAIVFRHPLMRCFTAGVCYAPAQRAEAGACSRFGQPLRWLWPGKGVPCRALREEMAGAAARNVGMRPARTDEG